MKKRNRLQTEDGFIVVPVCVCEDNDFAFLPAVLFCWLRERSVSEARPTRCLCVRDGDKEDE